MSVKRSFGLKSKWRLGKENAEYKENRKLRKNGGLGYAIEPEVVKMKSKKKSDCRKNEGGHEFVLQDNHKLPVMDDAYYFFKCVHCGKEEQKAKYKNVCAECDNEDWMYFSFGVKDRKKCKKCGSYEFKQIKNEPIV